MKLSPELRLSFDGLLLAIAAAEIGPSPADLAEAPVIDLWRPLMFGPRTVVLWGLVSGHPEIGSDYTTTSALVALDRERGWARTWNRWYRLAAPLPGLFPDTSGDPSRLRFTDFELPGFEVIENPGPLPELLADYIARVRAVARAARAAQRSLTDHRHRPDPDRGPPQPARRRSSADLAGTPITLPPVPFSALYARRRRADPALRWLLAQFLDVIDSTRRVSPVEGVV